MPKIKVDGEMLDLAKRYHSHLRGKWVPEKVGRDRRFLLSRCRLISDFSTKGPGAPRPSRPQCDLNSLTSLDVTVRDQVTAVIRSAVVARFLVFKETNVAWFRFKSH